MKFISIFYQFYKNFIWTCRELLDKFVRQDTCKLRANFVWTSYKLHDSFVCTSYAFHVKYNRSLHEICIKFICSSYEVCMKFICALQYKFLMKLTRSSYEIHIKLTWNSDGFHTKFTLNSYEHMQIWFHMYFICNEPPGPSYYMACWRTIPTHVFFHSALSGIHKCRDRQTVTKFPIID